MWLIRIAIAAQEIPPLPEASSVLSVVLRILNLPISVLVVADRWLYNQFRPKRAAIPETASIIRVVQIFDEVQNGNEYIRAPIRQFDVNEGSWIVKWNNWSYDINQDNVTAFETAFNNSLDRKVITFYNPEEKEFLDVDIDSSSIGIRIQDAQVPVKDVEEMLQRRNMYSRG